MQKRGHEPVALPRDTQEWRHSLDNTSCCPALSSELSAAAMPELTSCSHRTRIRGVAGSFRGGVPKCPPRELQTGVVCEKSSVFQNPVHPNTVRARMTWLGAGSVRGCAPWILIRAWPEIGQPLSVSSNLFPAQVLARPVRVLCSCVSGSLAVADRCQCK